MAFPQPIVKQVWSDIQDVSGSIAAGAVLGTYIFQRDGTAPIISTTAYTGKTNFLSLDPAQYAHFGKTIQVRVVGTVITNGTAPAITFTFGLYPVSSVAALVGTLGAAVGTIAVATPALNTRTAAWGTAITMPAAGPFLLAVALSGTAAVSSLTLLQCGLQVRAT